MFMAAFRRIAKTAPAWRIFSVARAPRRELSRYLAQRSFEHQSHFRAPQFQLRRWLIDDQGPHTILPAILAGFLGAGVLSVAYADANEGPGSPKPPLPSESSSGYVDLEEIAKKERQRIEELLRRKGMPYGSYPRFTVAVKGQKVTIKFQVPPAGEVPQLLANLVSNLGVKVEEHAGGSDMSLRAWDSCLAIDT